MPTTLAATHRISLTYTVDSLQHIIRAYCKRQDPLIGGPAVLDRNGSLIDANDAIQGLWDAVRGPLSSASTGAVNGLFEERSGSLWLPVSSHAPTGAGGSGASSKHAEQVTYVIRDTAFLKIHWVILETASPYVGHSANGIGVDGDLDILTHLLDGTTLTGNPPFLWQKSRGDHYFLASGCIAGLTLDLNDKLKRRRSLE